MRLMPTVENEWSSSSCWLFQVSDLLNQVVLLISELFIIRPFFLEIAQKLNELGLVFQQDLHDGLCFVWTGHKNLTCKQNRARQREKRERKRGTISHAQYCHKFFSCPRARGAELQTRWFNSNLSKAVPACGIVSPYFCFFVDQVFDCKRSC